MIEYSENLNKLKNNLITHKDYHPLLQKISLPFIPDFLDSSFDQSKNKVVIVGQETSGWGKLKLDSFILGNLSTNELISESKIRYRNLYEKPPVRSQFLKFLGKVKEKNNNEYIQWLNFYFFDYNKKSFNLLNSKNKSIDFYEHLKDISIENLVNQLDRLEPKNIFFLGAYHGNWEQLKLNYVNDEDILNFKESIEGFSVRFWNKKTLVIRLPHPASRVPNKGKIQQQALTYFDIFNNQAEQNPEKFKELIRDKLLN